MFRAFLAALLLVVSADRLSAAQSPSPASTVNPFAFELYRAMSVDHADENLFFSPLSLDAVLAMTAEGARGETAAEMGRLLHAPPARADANRPFDFAPLHTELSDLTDRLTSSRGHASKVEYSIFSSANALWADKASPFEKPFLKTINAYYRTGSTNLVDFRGDPAGSVRQINHWVDQQTHGRIKELFQPDEASKQTRLILVNAVYFLGKWINPFDVKNTQPRNFTVPDGKVVQAPTMSEVRCHAAKYAAFNADGSLFATPPKEVAEETTPANGYPDGSGFQVAELPYRGGKISMVVLLPQNPKDGLTKLQSLLTPDRLAQWSKQLDERTIDLTLPKFTLEQSIPARPILESLGMKRAFAPPTPDGGGAQFDGMCATTDFTQRLYVSMVVQKAFLQVDETGTEAVAASGAVMGSLSAKAPQPMPFIPVFHADHPFLFLIRDNDSGVILFVGRFVRPSA